MGGTIPGLVVLGSVRKQAEKAMRNKPVNSTLHGLCISSGLQVPALFEFLSSLLLLMNCALVRVSITVKRHHDHGSSYKRKIFNRG